MAFGKSLKEAPKKPASTGDGTTTSFVWQWMSTGNGHRKLRILPEVKNGELVKEPLTDAVGKVLKGKFTTIPETEVRWLEVWWPVMVGGNTKKQRIILDWEDQWGSPLWKYVQKNFEKGSEERRGFKQRFGVNVIDMSPVLFDANGRIVYADINGVYNVAPYGSGSLKQRVETLTGDAEPLNQVRIFEGSAGEQGGKSLLAQVADITDGLQDNDGKTRLLHEVTLMLKTQGEGIKLTRGIRASSDFSPLPDEMIFAPRYDIAEWAKPWPYEMVKRLMDFEDLNDLVEEYGIVLFPQLKPLTGETEASTDEEGLFED